MKHSDSEFDYVLNNAGLHAGIFNLIEFSGDETVVYDIDPSNDRVTKINKNTTNFGAYTNDFDSISKNYDDVEYIMERKENIIVKKKETVLQNQPVQEERIVDVSEVKRSVFG